jgi:hypothetical protein
MKISEVTAENRKKAFMIRTAKAEYLFPYTKLRVAPSVDDPIEEVFADAELGKEAFCYRLRSGAEDTVHLDEVREFAQDPEYLQELLLHTLTIEARRGLEESGLGKRQVSRLLGTSPTQLYRLLDPANQKKSVGQMLALLHLVDRDVSLVVKRRLPKSPDSTRERPQRKRRTST